MDFITCWAEQNKTKTRKWNEIGQLLVPGALNDNKTIRKAGGDIFASFGLEKPGNKLGKNNFSSGPWYFPWIWLKMSRIHVQTAGPHFLKVFTNPRRPISRPIDRSKWATCEASRASHFGTAKCDVR